MTVTVGAAKTNDRILDALAAKQPCVVVVRADTAVPCTQVFDFIERLEAANVTKPGGRPSVKIELDIGDDTMPVSVHPPHDQDYLESLTIRGGAASMYRRRLEKAPSDPGYADELSTQLGDPRTPRPANDRSPMYGTRMVAIEPSQVRGAQEFARGARQARYRGLYLRGEPHMTAPE